MYFPCRGIGAASPSILKTLNSYFLYISLSFSHFYVPINMKQERNMKQKLLLILLCLAGFSYAIPSLNNIAVGATYRMNLSTGDVLEGVVDSKSDTALILDCKGSAYTFTAALISDFTLLAPPKSQKQNVEIDKSKSEALTYSDLRQQNPVGKMLDVTITSGATFRGKLNAIDDENIRLDIDGSIIPVAQKIVTQILTVAIASTPKKETAIAPPPASVVYDTLVVKNSQTDDYGKPLPDNILVGKITRDDRQGVTIMLVNNETQSYSFDHVVRICKHSKEDSEEDRIKRYAQPLFCPQGMILVDMPPGKAGRPFFKVCIDKYEFPNKEGTIPQINISVADAQNACEQAGKRLCTSEEWQWACSGLEAYQYPYGKVFEKENCNIDGGRNIEPSGNRNRCTSKFGAVDMVGNVFEWVRIKDGLAGAMGGPLSKCQTVSAGGSGDAKPTIGFRCCKSN